MLEKILMDIASQFGTQALFAVLAGFIGACALVIPSIKNDGLFLGVVFILFGMTTSYVCSDILVIYFENDRLSFHMMIGMASGCIGGSIFIVFRAVSPKLANEVINIFSKTSIELLKIGSKAITSLANSRIAKGLAIIFGKGE